MDDKVAGFYDKHPEQGYVDQYDKDHGPRIQWCIDRFKLSELRNSRVVDVGCGRGNYFKRLPSPDQSGNTYVGLDGANLGPDKKLVPYFQSLRVDFDEPFGQLFDNEGKFDFLICSETLEHCKAVDNILLSMKSLLKVNGRALITIPHVSCTHPVAYPGLFYPEQNFKIFIEQYAWIVEDFEVFKDGWPTCCFFCRNAPMIEQRPLFAKSEPQFQGSNPIDWTNL